MSNSVELADVEGTNNVNIDDIEFLSLSLAIGNLSMSDVSSVFKVKSVPDILINNIIKNRDKFFYMYMYNIKILKF